MPDIVNLYDAKTHLSQLVERAAAGEEIVIAKSGKPKAKRVPYEESQKNAASAVRTCLASPTWPTIGMRR